MSRAVILMVTLGRRCAAHALACAHRQRPALPVTVWRDTRPPGRSLGAARNEAVAAMIGEHGLTDKDWFVPWDDDDHYHPDHCAILVESVSPGDAIIYPGVWLGICPDGTIVRREFWRWGLHPGSAINVGAFRAVGGYLDVDVAENDRIASQCYSTSVIGPRVPTVIWRRNHGHHATTGDVDRSEIDPGPIVPRLGPETEALDRLMVDHGAPEITGG